MQKMKSRNKRFLYSLVTAKQQEVRRQLKTYLDKPNIISTSKVFQTTLSTYYSNWGIA